jgi:hypothetical protein
MRNHNHQASSVRRQRLLVLLTAVSGLLLGACSSIDCPVKNKVRAVYSIRRATTMAADTLKDTLYVRSKRADGSDTLLLNGSSKVLQFSVQVSYNRPEDTLFFNFRNGAYNAVDTVWLKKDDMPHFESVDCNPTYFHRLTAVRSTNHAIDSITINNPTVTYDDSSTQHLYLYLKSHN